MFLKRATPTEIIVKGLMLFSVLTVIQGIGFFDDINKIWLAVISMVLLLRLLKYSYSLTQLLMLMLTVLVHILAVCFTDFPLENFNMLFYFLLWVMLYVFFAKSKDRILISLNASSGYIKAILWTWTILVGISAFLPSCYEGRYFYSFSGTSFRLMPAALIIEALALYMAFSKKNRWYELFLILPTYAAFMNQSRTYFGVYIAFLLMYIYMCSTSKHIFYLKLLLVLCIVLMLMPVSGIADKLEATQYEANPYYGFWETVTSGRAEFWVWDLEAFFALPFWQQFVGNGFNFVYEVNGSYLTHGIWAHNDFINLLMNFGYIGVMIYLWVYFLMLKTFWPKGNRIPFEVKALFQGAVFINSMMNMSYTYLCAMISYPLFLCVIAERYPGERL